MRINVCENAIMQPTYDRNAPKKATNLSLNSALLAQAKELGINLSASLEAALEEIVRRKQEENWLAENRAAIASYNQYVAENGTFADDLRGF